MYQLLSFMGETPRAVRKFVSDDHAQYLDIPFAEGNTDYAAYLAWVAEGNTPLPAEGV